jgi:alginate O-acetyltransferase complex protein AlgI
MMFHTQAFLVFFAIVFAVHWGVIGGLRARHVFLFAASAVFYMSWNAPLLLLLLASCAIGFVTGRLAHDTQGKRWVTIGIGINLMILGFFKYADFGIQSVNELLRATGYGGDLSLLHLTLPLGISFYTFQSMSYIIDMYRRKYAPYESALEFFLYISFFPQLVAGPIVRGDFFRKQLSRPTPLRAAYINQGVTLFVIGAFKKVILADQAAVFANAIFGDPGAYTTVLATVGVIAFSLQIYFDFSAYTDMARGLGFLLGYRLPENFRHPYGALGFRDFWRKWHISLSTWLRDYLYIPLGGSRTGAWRVSINLMITMLLGGLWHGAGWNFFIWGGLHGVFLATENFLTKKRSLRVSSAFGNAAIALMTFGAVSFAWIFFRAPTLDVALGVIRAVGTLPEAGGLLHQAGLFKAQNWILGFIAPAFVVVVSAVKPVDKTLNSYPVVVSAAAVACMLMLSAIIAGGASEFIYFQF